MVEIGQLNSHKSEIIYDDPVVRGNIITEYLELG